jgi:hypothetical protein
MVKMLKRNNETESKHTIKILTFISYDYNIDKIIKMYLGIVNADEIERLYNETIELHLFIKIFDEAVNNVNT